MQTFIGTLDAGDEAVPTFTVHVRGADRPRFLLNESDHRAVLAWSEAEYAAHADQLDAREITEHRAMMPNASGLYDYTGWLIVTAPSPCKCEDR